MLSRTLVLTGATLLCGLTTPTHAQFGVGNRNRPKGAATFEELNKMAAERMATDNQKGGDLGALGNLDALGDLSMDDISALMKDIDPNTLESLIKEGLKDEGMQEMMAGMADAMDELFKMDPDELKAQMEEAMKMLTSADMQETIMNQKEDVLALMEAQGTASKEEIEEYRNDPQKFQEAMNAAFGQMKEIFSDEKALDTVVQMMKGFGAIMDDPNAAMSKLGGVLQDALADDEKIEEARLQLLQDPSVAGNEAISDMFGTEEMQEILKDPVKWRKSVKEGQRMLMGGEAEHIKEAVAGGGMGMGEL